MRFSDMGGFEWTTLAMRVMAIFVSAFIAVMAIFGEYVRAYFMAPKLNVRLRRTRTKVESLSGVQHRFIHLVVANGNRLSPVRNVFVVVTKIERYSDELQAWGTSYDTGPAPLKWQFAQLWNRERRVGFDQICDLGYLVQDGFKLEIDIDVASLNLWVRANERMRVHLKAVGDNSDSPCFVVEIEWDGNWVNDDAQMERHLKLKCEKCQKEKCPTETEQSC